MGNRYGYLYVPYFHAALGTWRDSVMSYAMGGIIAVQPLSAIIITLAFPCHPS